MGFERKAYNSKTVKDGLRRKIRAAMDVAAQEAAASMRETISTDTKTKASLERGGGRIRTKTMLNAVKNTKPRISESGKSYLVFWGWSTADRNANSDRMTEKDHRYKSYFDLQDWGFTHTSGSIIEGMHAQEAAKRRFKEVMRREWRR